MPTLNRWWSTLPDSAGKSASTVQPKFAKRLSGGAVIANNKNRKKKALWTDLKGGAKIKLFRGSDELEEAEYIEVTKTHQGRTPATLLCLTQRGRLALHEYTTAVKDLLTPAEER